ncbi:Acetyltransferase (GNAT) family protein [Terribacillus aidingensis]|uniref:Acetyltransferase (GNAT) family protein n=1 Tax=Terribacillus aidingensis TaxID=586416 RepID=A0A285P5Y3_9BACI|nr:GNAT family N-acetyltransferase [Terribacillus aidingensis]SNZ17132.1 Acetyltransferase (GNAT) family protein [Terribacillus aidingensis]
MGYEISSLTADDAYTVLHWRYSPPYDLYNLTYTEGAVMMLMVGDYYGVYENGSLFGYFCVGEDAQVPGGDYSDKSYLDIGIGMAPQLTGQGRGKVFFRDIQNWINQNKQQTRLRLTVAAFNERAIHLYANAGFWEAGRFARDSDQLLFLVMTKSPC